MPWDATEPPLSEQLLLSIHFQSHHPFKPNRLYWHRADRPANYKEIKGLPTSWVLTSVEHSVHYSDVIMMVSQITGVSILCSTVCSGADQKKISKFCVTGLCEGNSPVTSGSPHKQPVMQKVFPFDDVVMGLHHIMMVFAVELAPGGIYQEYLCTEPLLPINSWKPTDWYSA